MFCFQGMAASGSWCCLDEVDRLDYQTMSLIAQQLLTVQKNIKAEAVVITLAEFTLKLKPSCAIFITSNPHETQSKISNNLKLRFRPITIAVPDILLILQVHLETHGFENSEKIASELNQFHEVLKDRLSTQSFYEFGLRNVLVIIGGAAARKRMTKDLNIELIVSELEMFHRPKLYGNDLDIFNDQLKHIFGAFEAIPELETEKREKILLDICEKRNIVCSPYVVQKTTEIKSLLKKNVHVIVLGEPYSGKTICVSLARECLLEEAKQEVRI